MKEKELAAQSDLMSHIAGDWKSVHGIWEKIKALVIAKTSFYLNGTGQISKLLVQVGSSSTLVGGTTITFDIAFAAAPVVVASCSSNTTYTGTATSITTTNFSGRCYDHAATAGKAGTIKWIAIGERP